MTSPRASSLAGRFRARRAGVDGRVDPLAMFDVAAAGSGRCRGASRARSAGPWTRRWAARTAHRHCRRYQDRRSRRPSPSTGTQIRCPSVTTWARLSCRRSAAVVKPPAAAIASATLESGCLVHPRMTYGTVDVHHDDRRSHVDRRDRTVNGTCCTNGRDASAGGGGGRNAHHAPIPAASTPSVAGGGRWAASPNGRRAGRALGAT